MLIAALEKLHEGKGAGRAVFEERVMGRLAYFATGVCGELCEAGFALRTLSASPDEVPPALQRGVLVALNIPNELRLRVCDGAFPRAIRKFSSDRVLDRFQKRIGD